MALDLPIGGATFSKTRYRQFTSTPEVQMTTDNFRHVTAFYQQIAGFYITFITKGVQRYLNLPTRLANIPAITTGNGKSTVMPVMRQWIIASLLRIESDSINILMMLESEGNALLLFA